MIVLGRMQTRQLAILSRHKLTSQTLGKARHLGPRLHNECMELRRPGDSGQGTIQSHRISLVPNFEVRLPNQNAKKRKLLVHCEFHLNEGA